MDPSVSIIIPSYNSMRTILHTLESIKKQKSPHVREVLVVDSSDAPEMKDVIRKYRSNTVRFINAGVRVKPALGRNIGAEKAKGKILLFLDSDVILETNYIDHIIDAYRQGMLAGCGAIDVPDFQQAINIVLAQYYLQVSEYIPMGETRRQPILAGCNLYCDRGVFAKAGGFPDIRASEDVLLGQNINKITATWFIPGAVVRHIFREDASGYFANQKLLGTYVGILRSSQSASFIYKGVMPLLLMPLFFAYKHFLIIKRVLAAGRRHSLRLLKTLPMVSLGVWYWTLGMAQGARRKEN